MQLRARFRQAVVIAWMILRLRPRSRSELVRLGSDYGGWWVPRSVLKPGSVCLCAGAGEDITFEEALCEQFKATVVTVDPTPRAIAHVERKAPQGDFRFLPVGLAGKSGSRKFYAPANRHHVSHSITNLQRTSEYFEAECLTVDDIMATASLTRLDLIKLDIEGAEHETIQNLLESPRLPSTICVEFDQPDQFRYMRKTIASLCKAGYRAEKVERFNVTFVLHRQDNEPTRGALR